MRTLVHLQSRRGFALVLTLSLMALLMLALYALGTLVRVNGEISSASAYQFEARQNALLGLAQAVGSLQRLAGRDDAVTAMAGIAGEPDGSPRRHWCGVWDRGGSFLGWLTSGAANTRAPQLETANTVILVGTHSVGSALGDADNEHVEAGKVSILAPQLSGGTALRGAYAYWVGDEGVKVSAYAPAARLPPGGLGVVVASRPTNVARIGLAFQQFDPERAAKIVLYEQSPNLAYTAGAKLGAANVQAGFHHVTRTHLGVSPGGAGYWAGQVNVNTTSAIVWRSLIETYETAPAVKPFGTTTKRTQAINAIANGIAASADGKAAGGPFTAVDAFLEGGLPASATSGKNGISAAEFAEVMKPMLSVRSDTFRVRVYGEAVNRVDPERAEAIAYGEAIVQRTPENAAGGPGRKCVVTYFRWLGPDDI